MSAGKSGGGCRGGSGAPSACRTALNDGPAPRTAARAAPRLFTFDILNTSLCLAPSVTPELNGFR